ncbi:ran-binding proteins 9/10 homolog isoform X2 [Drosophila subpulchrella]|uniref:ran-binding proteins 9/10 homolog isoform X2 n=1 Tax=Drosophila subpulchrella TaxID=1486046 RepID=UPI0018A17689|nr:ran-binding proteins 9/10 homolog isoform X2 [Drosophila subpulchrella]
MENVEEAPPLSSESNSNSNNSSASSSSHQLSQSGAMGAEAEAEAAPSSTSSQSLSRSHSHSPTPTPAAAPSEPHNPISHDHPNHPNPPLNPSEMEARENSPHDHSPTPTFHQTAPPPTTPSTAPQREERDQEEQDQQPQPALQDQDQRENPEQHPQQDQDQEFQEQQPPQPVQDPQPEANQELLHIEGLIRHRDSPNPEGNPPQAPLEDQPLQIPGQEPNQEPNEAEVREEENQPEAEPPPPLLLEDLDEQDQDSESQPDLSEQQQQEQEHHQPAAVIIDANAIAETIDANAVERIDDYEDDDEEVDEEEEVVDDRVDRAAEVASVSGAQRLHSVAVLPRYSAASRASRSNNNNNNNNSNHNNNNNNNSSGSSRRTRHFYSNNGSHFSNDMFPSHAPRSSTQTSSPRVGGRRQHSTPAASSNSPQHQGVDPLRLLYPNVNESETPLPRCWSPHDKCLSIGLSQNNLRVTYKGVGKQHSDAASVRTAYPIPSSCGLYYFEVRIISKGRNGYMGIGLTAQQFRMNRLPGWDKQSYGYHGDDGNSFSSSGNGQTYGPTFTTGDVIGCCVNFVNNTCFYTKNGVDLGIAFRDLPTKLYPTVGLQTPGEEVDANFGQEPFKFDKIVDMMKEMRSNVLRKIDRYPHLLETPENLMNRLVSTYLVHNAFSKTAEAFNGYTNQSFDEDLSSVKIRQKIIKLILTGKMSQAIEHTLRSFPGLLEKNKNLWFALKCRQFIEMINGADIENVNNKVTATTQTMPTNQTSVIQSTKAFKHSKSGNGNGNVNLNQTQQQQNNTAIPAVIKPQGGDKPDIKNMLVDDNSNKCVDHDSNSMDVEMEPCQSHSNGGDSCSNSNGNASAVRNSLDAIDEEMDVSPSSRSCGRVIEKILEFGKELSSMGQQLEEENRMTEEERQMLEDAFSLIAYSNPWSSPLGWLLCPSRRENVSTTLNSAILESLNCERRPPLEYLVAHAAELIKVIGQHSLGEDAFITIDDVFPQN